MNLFGIQDAYPELLMLVNRSGVVRESRNGKVKCLPEAILLTFRCPLDRVLTCKLRRANPFFHVAEAIWMLAGRNDVSYVRHFNKQMYTYSDDGNVFNAAYGHRWRKHFQRDQLLEAALMLKANPADRRVVIGMWDARQDLNSKSLDLPCNTQIMFRIEHGKLNMTTTNRSNDLIWGLCGANWVHMTILQEWMAAAVGVPVGIWQHMTNNLHVYEHHWPLLEAPPQFTTAPVANGLRRLPVVQNALQFLLDAENFVQGEYHLLEEPWLVHTALPMVKAWEFHKQGETRHAREQAAKTEDDMWRRAAMGWLQGVRQ